MRTLSFSGESPRTWGETPRAGERDDPFGVFQAMLAVWQCGPVTSAGPVLESEGLVVLRSPHQSQDNELPVTAGWFGSVFKEADHG